LFFFEKTASGSQGRNSKELKIKVSSSKKISTTNVKYLNGNKGEYIQ